MENFKNTNSITNLGGNKMSSKCCCNQRPMAMPMPHCGYQGGGLGTGCCNFSALIILILILLFFGQSLAGKRRGPCDEHEGHGGFLGGTGIFGGIIFIITLFYLSCCGPGKCAMQMGC